MFTNLINKFQTVNLLTATADAAATGTPAEPVSMWGSVIMLVVFFAFAYFFMIRPQKKQEKETKQMRDSITVGDEITTIGGITGKVCNVRDDTLTIETGADRTKLKIARWAVRSIDKKFGEEHAEEAKTTAYKVKKKEQENASEEK